MFDVAVIGSGPSGALLARLMACRGYSVILFEEHGSPGDPVNCSGVIGAEAFQRYDLPLNPIVRTIHSFRFYSPSGCTLDYFHPKPLAVVVNRSAFDVEMAAAAVAAGAVLRTRSRVNEIRLENDAVSLFVQGEIVKSKLVAIATGAGSKLPEQLGLGKPKKYVLGAQTETAVDDLEQVEIHLGQNVAKSNFAWVIPLQSGRAKIGLICRKDARAFLKQFLHNLYDQGRVLSLENSIRCSLLPIETIQQSYTDRTIVIGEAAGQIKTITCGGIYYGLLAAELGANALEQALVAGDFRAASLAVYEKQWKSLLGKELSMGSRLRSIFEHLSDQKLDAFFEVATKDGLMKLIREKVNFDWHYELVTAILRHQMVRAVLQPSLYLKLMS